MKRHFSILTPFLTVFTGFSLIVVSTLALAGPPLKKGNPGVPGLLAEIAALEDEIADLQDQVAALQSKALVPQTGQTMCWNESDMLTNCDDTGQDGDIQAGVIPPDPRFTVNNGTVTDHLTGLLWLLDASCDDLGPNGNGRGTWQEALDAANELADGICGLTDGSIAGNWRLPNVRELESLIDYGNVAPALPTGHPFSGIPSPPFAFSIPYWSSTTPLNSPNMARFVNLGIGSISTIFKDPPPIFFDLNFIWPVRGGQ